MAIRKSVCSIHIRMSYDLSVNCFRVGWRNWLLAEVETKVEVEVIFRLMACQSVCLGCRADSGTCDQILLPVGMLLSESYGLVSVGAPSLMRGRVSSLQCNHSMVRVAQNP
jgi:hypothetical protein